MHTRERSALFKAILQGQRTAEPRMNNYWEPVVRKLSSWPLRLKQKMILEVAR